MSIDQALYSLPASCHWAEVRAMRWNCFGLWLWCKFNQAVQWRMLGGEVAAVGSSYCSHANALAEGGGGGGIKHIFHGFIAFSPTCTITYTIQCNLCHTDNRYMGIGFSYSTASWFSGKLLKLLKINTSIPTKRIHLCFTCVRKSYGYLKWFLELWNDLQGVWIAHWHLFYTMTTVR